MRKGRSMELKKTVGVVVHHGKILLRGLVKTLYGTAVSGLAGLAVYGFVMIPSEGGYAAVCEFMVAALTLGMAMGAMYAFGGRKQKKNVGRYTARK